MELTFNFPHLGMYGGEGRRVLLSPKERVTTTLHINVNNLLLKLALGGHIGELAYFLCLAVHVLVL
jgi:hypothetical protein